MQLYYSINNWRILVLIFLSVIMIAGFSEISHINHYLNTNFIFDIVSTLSTVGLFIINFFYKTYDLIYYKIFNIPIIFWLLIVINVFLIYILKLENLKFILNNLLTSYILNKNISFERKYLNFKDFICSSYGAVSVAAIAEIIILLSNYNTPGSIFWMCITILILGLIQLCEIIINCRYVSDHDQKSCFMCVLQYIVGKYSSTTRIKKYLVAAVGIYAASMIMTSFFSATMFQIEQSANLYVQNGGRNLSTLIFIGATLLVVLFISSFKQYRIALKINNFLIPKLLIIFISIIGLFLICNMHQVVQTIWAICDDITNPQAILPGVVSGLVISFARYIYKKYNDYENDYWAIYEENDLIKATVMYSIESFFMIFLIGISGIAFYICSNFIDHSFFFSLNIKYFISLFLVFFGFSVIINEAIYSKVALSHLFKMKEIYIDWIVRIFLFTGLIMGLFPQTDQWVDIADHISVIFLVINLLSFFLLKKESNDLIEYYRPSIKYSIE